jgi:hypothetical protein
VTQSGSNRPASRGANDVFRWRRHWMNPRDRRSTSFKTTAHPKRRSSTTCSTCLCFRPECDGTAATRPAGHAGSALVAIALRLKLVHLDEACDLVAQRFSRTVASKIRFKSPGKAADWGGGCDKKVEQLPHDKRGRCLSRPFDTGLTWSRGTAIVLPVRAYFQLVHLLA